MTTRLVDLFSPGHPLHLWDCESAVDELAGDESFALPYLALVHGRAWEMLLEKDNRWAYFGCTPAPHAPQNPPSSIGSDLPEDLVRAFEEVIPGILTADSIQDTNVSEAVRAYLGRIGVGVLKKVLRLVEIEALGNLWPLVRVTVHLEATPEIEEEEYVVVQLLMGSSFERADQLLHGFYPKIQALVDDLVGPARLVLTDKIYLAVEVS